MFHLRLASGLFLLLGLLAFVGFLACLFTGTGDELHLILTYLLGAVTVASVAASVITGCCARNANNNAVHAIHIPQANNPQAVPNHPRPRGANNLNASARREYNLNRLHQMGPLVEPHLQAPRPIQPVQSATSTIPTALVLHPHEVPPIQSFSPNSPPVYGQPLTAPVFGQPLNISCFFNTPHPLPNVALNSVIVERTPNP